MSEHTRVSHPIYDLLPTEIAGFDSLAELALDMHWSWNHATDEVWRLLDPKLWERTHNPWVVLQTASRDHIERVLADPVFRKNVDSLMEASRQAAEAPAWFQKNHADAPLTSVVYFSMEFMLSEALPIYSGGLGNVAGDQLKAASDLGVPVLGVGLLYQQGYFRQVIDKAGAQQALFPYNDPGQLPVTPLRQPNGEWLRLEIALPGYSVWLRAWQVQVGRVKLYLLDSNDAANFPAHRGITSELYGGGPELRLKQAHGRALRLRSSSRSEQPRQIAQSRRRSLRLVELETNLQVAPVQVELGNLIFLQEFNQLFQIVDVLWFHSFLNSPASERDGLVLRSKFDQSLGRWGEHLASSSGNGHHIFDANAEALRQINSRLDRDDHTGEQPACLSSADARRLVNLQTDAMAGGVGKRLRQSCLAQHAAGCLIDLRAAYARSNRGDAGLLRLQHSLIDGALAGRGSAQVNGSGHIRAVTFVNNTKIHGHKTSAG